MADMYDPQSTQEPGQYPATAWTMMGLPVPPASTGAPGSVGTDPAATSGPVVGTPVVSNPYGSSQVAVNRPTEPVTAGKTSGFSDDTPIHLSSPFLPGGTQGSRPDETGAGRGRAGHFDHPNSLGAGGAVSG